MTHKKPGRNDKCSCGSGKKFKQCCEAKQGAAASRLLLMAVAGIIVAAIFFGISAARHASSATPNAGQVWSPEHGHYH